jgi:hypothetical protein
MRKLTNVSAGQGGRFAALEEPLLLTNDLQRFGKKIFSQFQE